MFFFKKHKEIIVRLGPFTLNMQFSEIPKMTPLPRILAKILNVQTVFPPSGAKFSENPQGRKSFP